MGSHTVYRKCVKTVIEVLKYCILCFVDGESRYNRVKKDQLDAQFIFSIFRQPLHVSDLSRPIIRR